MLTEDGSCARQMSAVVICATNCYRVCTRFIIQKTVLQRCTLTVKRMASGCISACKTGLLWFLLTAEQIPSRQCLISISPLFGPRPMVVRFTWAPTTTVLSRHMAADIPLLRGQKLCLLFAMYLLQTPQSRR